MEKRKLMLGSYNTATSGWTLASLKLSAATRKTNFIDIPGGDGTVDLALTLSDGIPRYGDRTLTAKLECSEGTRLERKTLIRTMLNALDGLRMNIVLPDDPDYYLDGIVHVAVDYNDLAHASVTVTAVCNPWLYKKTETSQTFTASTTAKTTTLPNSGRLIVIPTITVTGGTVLLVVGSSSKSFSAGTYLWPDLMIRNGGQSITYSGSGSIKFTYREAVLE